MQVFIDNRELALVRLLSKICEPKVVRLPYGDLLIVNESSAMVVERKTVSDLIGSIRSNRLWSQLLALMKVEKILGHEVKRRLLVIHGGFWEYTNVSRVNQERYWSSIFGALLAVNFVYDTPCIVCENNQAFETFLRILLQREAKGKHERLPQGRWERKSLSRLPIRDVKQYVLDAIPMVGEARAKSLLDSFGSISNIAQQSKEELMKVEGIGEKRARRIYEILH